MAYFPWTPALTAIREVVDSAAGSLRTIPSTRFTEDLIEGTSEEELQRRGVRADIPVRVDMLNRRKNPASPPINSSIIIRDADIVVTVSRTIGPVGQTDSDQMAALKALAYEDADALEQALTTPPNLATTVAGTATNIIGDALIYNDSAARVVSFRTPSKAQRLETVHRFIMTMKIAPATS